MTDSDFKSKLAAELFSRLGEAVNLGLIDVSTEQWQPVANDCHQNVTDICDGSDQFEAARGWLVHYHTENLEYVFISHSVVRSKTDGLYYEITPRHPLTLHLQFIPSGRTEAEFRQIVEDRKIAEVRYRP